MLRRPHALMTASLISISGITRLSSMSMHPYLSDIGETYFLMKQGDWYHAVRDYVERQTRRDAQSVRHIVFQVVTYHLWGLFLRRRGDEDAPGAVFLAALYVFLIRYHYYSQSSYFIAVGTGT